MRILLLQFTFSKILSTGLSILIPIFLAQQLQDAAVFSSFRAIEFAPYIVMGLVVGAIIDSIGAKKVMRWSIYLHLVPLLLFFGVAFGVLPLSALYISLFFMSAVVYSVSACTSRVAYEVLDKVQLANFNAKTSLLEQIVLVLLPIVMGWALIYSLKITLLFLCLFSFLVSLYAPVTDKRVQLSAVQWFSIFIERFNSGIKAFKNNRTLVYLSIVIMLINAVETIPATLMVFYATQELRLSPTEIGVIITVSGIGGVVGAWALGYVNKQPSMLLVFLVLSMFVNGMLYYLVYIYNNYLALLISMFIEAVSIVISTVSFRTLRQLCSTPDNYGTTLGISGALVKCAIPVATLIGGYISNIYSVRAVYLMTAGVELLLTVPITLWALQSYRKSAYEI